jgi:hypothetical protein
MSAFGRPYLMLAFYKIFWIIFTYVGSYYLVKQIITYVETTPLDQREATSSRNGYLYAFGLFLTCVGSSICIQQVMAECTRIGVQVSINNYPDSRSPLIHLLRYMTWWSVPPRHSCRP